MMNHTRRVFVCLLGLVVILSILVFPISAQGNDSGAAKYEEDYLLQSQRNFDRSLSILDTVATLIGIVVGIFAIVIAIVGGLGFLEIKKWHQMRNDIEDDAEIVRELKTKVEKYADTIRNEAKNIPKTISTEKPTDEIRRELDEYGHRLETLELLGVSLKPEDYINRGNDLFYKNDYESALKAYDKAIELKPNDAKILNNKAAVFVNLGRLDEILEFSEKAIEIKPDYAPAWFNHACAYSLKGNKKMALSDLKKAIELDASGKERAKKDESFKTLWDDEDFKKLVE